MIPKTAAWSSGHFTGDEVRTLITSKGTRFKLKPGRGETLWSMSVVMRRIAWPLDSANDGECWLYYHGRNPQRYGALKIGEERVFAHRLAYELRYGKIPDGLFVCHSCDTPACINPNHLHLGTAAQNSRECNERGRRPLGTKVHSSKLDTQKVAEIRAMLRGGMSYSQIADSFGVSATCVRQLGSGQTWRHVP